MNSVISNLLETPSRTVEDVKPAASRPRPPRRTKRPRILIVTPEMNGSKFLSPKGYIAPRAKAGGLADVSTLLFDALAEQGMDVHVAMPHFRNLFHSNEGSLSRRFHLCPDREFFYRRFVYDGDAAANLRASLAFQRDVIHHVIPRVKPDIVHCHDWMTALVPAAARSMSIKSFFTIHNLHDERATLSQVEDRGIDAGQFWQHLHFSRFPYSYDESRSHNPVNFMASAIHAADEVSTVSTSFLHEVMEGRHRTGDGVVDGLRAKHYFGKASGILNALDPSNRPMLDPFLVAGYQSADHAQGKAENKRHLQRLLGLEENPDAPMLFWPSRLDPTQKGCQLLAEILYQVVHRYWDLGLQVVFVADGPYKQHFHHIVDFHGLRSRIAVRGFTEELSRQGYAASDFTLVPSAYEPCGLAQMIGLNYGSLPIVHRTGGLADTVSHLDSQAGTGNGFVFETHDSQGLFWAIDEAIRFHVQPAEIRRREITRIMSESERSFSPEPCIGRYMDIYRSLYR